MKHAIATLLVGVTTLALFAEEQPFAEEQEVTKKPEIARWEGRPLSDVLSPELTKELAGGAWTLLLHPACHPAVPALEKRFENRKGPLVSIVCAPFPSGTRKRPLFSLDTVPRELGTEPVVFEAEGGRWKTLLHAPGLSTWEIGEERPFLDLGFVEGGSVHTATFRLENGSGSPVTVTKAVSGCVCTKISLQPREIAPGEFGLLTAEFHAPEKALTFDKPIRLEFQDGVLPPASLSMRARVGLPLRVEFLEKEGDLPRVFVRNLDTRPWRLLYATASGGLSARVPKEPIPPGELCELAVSSATGATGIQFMLRTNCPTQRSVSVTWKRKEKRTPS